MLGYFNPILGKIWTNPNVGLKIYFQINTTFTFNCTFLIAIFNPTFGFVHILPKFESVNSKQCWVVLTQFWVKQTNPNVGLIM